jgi:hypothetical protein
MPDDPDKTLQELGHRIATEGLPKLSAEVLRSFKREDRHGPKLAQPTVFEPLLSLSPEALRRSAKKLIPYGYGSGDNRFFQADESIRLDLQASGHWVPRRSPEHPMPAPLSRAWLGTRMAC